jgi:hypothetical protein
VLRAWLAAAALLAAGCGGGEAAVGCAHDSDCPSGGRCVAQVCVDFRNGFDAAIPDLAHPDLAPTDGPPTD